MSDKKGVTEQPVEGDKQRDSAESPDRPPVDAVKSLDERVQLAKSDETYTKVKKFTFGDGGFGIDGLEEASGEAVVDAKGKKGQIETQTIAGRSGSLRLTTLTALATKSNTPRMGVSRRSSRRREGQLPGRAITG